MLHIQFTKYVQRGGQVVGNNPLGSTPTALPNYGCGSWGAVYPSHTIVPAGMTAPQGWIFKLKAFLIEKKIKISCIYQPVLILTRYREKLERREIRVSEE